MEPVLTNYFDVQAELKPQHRHILNHCARTGYITPRAAMSDYGIMSLSSRASELKRLGFIVRTEERKNPGTGQRYRRYFIQWPSQQAAAA